MKENEKLKSEKANRPRYGAGAPAYGGAPAGGAYVGGKFNAGAFGQSLLQRSMSGAKENTTGASGIF